MNSIIKDGREPTSCSSLIKIIIVLYLFALVGNDLKNLLVTHSVDDS